MAIGRRAVLLGAAGTAGLLLGGCTAPFADVRLRIATGSEQGVYFGLGTALAAAWRADLDLAATPQVLVTAGSRENVNKLAAGEAEVVFSQVDVAVEQLGTLAADDPRAPRALARVYDDVVHLVVPAGSPIRSVSDLRGARVSVGAANSGVRVVAGRVLGAAGLAETDLAGELFGLDASVTAMLEGRIDAFFWSGGLPTPAIEKLAAARPVRLVDLAEGGVLATLRDRYDVYAPGTVPAQRYAGLADPVTTLLIRNFLLVAAAMPDDLAAALVDVLFTEREQLAGVSQAALTIDRRAAIGTEPVQLHPGALRFYRDGRG